VRPFLAGSALAVAVALAAAELTLHSAARPHATEPAAVPSASARSIDGAPPAGVYAIDVDPTLASFLDGKLEPAPATEEGRIDVAFQGDLLGDSGATAGASGVPEPSTLTLIGLGLPLLGAARPRNAAGLAGWRGVQYDAFA
jgi:hypothetical protein